MDKKYSSIDWKEFAEQAEVDQREREKARSADRETWQRVYHIGQKSNKRIGTFYYDDAPGAIKEFDRVIVNVQNTENCNRSQALLYLIERGMKDYAKGLPDDTLESKIVKMIIEKRQAMEEFNKLDELRKLIDIEDFLQFCDENNVDLDKYYLHVSEKRQELKQSELRQAFLYEVLNGNKPVHTSVIKQLAYERGIIENEGDWNTLKTQAHRMGLSNSGERGMWALNKKNMPTD